MKGLSGAIVMCNLKSSKKGGMEILLRVIRGVAQLSRKKRKLKYQEK